MSTSIPIQLSIVIVNWRSKDYALECIKTLTHYPPHCSYEIIVIDCASNDGIAQALSQVCPGVHVIESMENLGFARANNTAAQEARGEFLLLLNPDTEVTAGALDAMLQVMSSQSDVGIAGARLLNTDRTIQTSCIQAFPCLSNQLLDSEFLRIRFPNSRLWGNSMLYQSTNQPVPVDAVSGACLLVRGSLFHAGGGLSEEFFMYSEDVDICHRASTSGYRVMYVPSALVVHHGGRSSRQQTRRQFSNVMMVESRCRYFHKTRGQAYSTAYRVGIGVASILRIPLTILHYLHTALFSSTGPCASPYFKWASILHWAVARTSALQKYAPPGILSRLLASLHVAPPQHPKLRRTLFSDHS